jgi:hypothetical protein
MLGDVRGKTNLEWFERLVVWLRSCPRGVTIRWKQLACPSEAFITFSEAVRPWLLLVCCCSVRTDGE